MVEVRSVMKITKEWLKEKDACKEGVDWFNNQSKIDSLEVLEALMKEDKNQWGNWLICRLFDRKQRIQYAVFAAEQVIDIFEKKYPNDKRPRLAIEAAKKVLEDDNEVNRKLAYAAATTDAAAYAAIADAAAYAAYYAAYYAADAAAYAAAYATIAAAAYYAAYYAADAAAYAATATTAAYAKKQMQIKILNYGLKLLKEKQNDDG